MFIPNMYYNMNFPSKLNHPYGYRHFNQIPNFEKEPTYNHEKISSNDIIKDEIKMLPEANEKNNSRNSIIDLINSLPLEDLLIMGLIYLLIKNDFSSNIMLIGVLFLILLEK